ncbi:MAG: potassium channel family protein [Nanoarchaeota archaeon]|nr:potassium channel family protein [Nanoarchaeota archaeon]
MFEKESLERRVFFGLGVISSLLFIGSLFIHIVEKFSWVDSIYFCVVTLSTIGYGDLLPKHEITKVFLIFYILIGVPAALYVFTSLGSYFTEKHKLLLEKTVGNVKTNREHINRARKRIYSAREGFRNELVGHKKKKNPKNEEED